MTAAELFNLALGDQAITAFATFFVVLDPIGLLPLFIALTAGFSAARRRRVALNALVIAGAVLALFGLVGEATLRVVGIGLPAFRISGGVMLFLIALEMLFERRSQRRGATAQEASAEAQDDEAHDPTVFPLATPLLAGPGAMASMVLVASKAEETVDGVVVYLALFVVLATTYLLFLAAGSVERLLGPTGVKLITRLFGVLLGALAVQFILDGLADFGFVTSP